MRLRLIAITLLVLLVLWGASRWRGEARTGAQPEAGSTFVQVERGPIRLAVEATGRVAANLDVDIKCKASGQVVKLPFDISDPVRAGDLLVELDPVDEQRRARQAKVALASAEARLAQARQTVRIFERNIATERQRAESTLTSARQRHADTSARAARVQELLAKALASQEQSDAAVTAAAQASADLSSAHIRLEELRTQELELENRRQDVRLAEADVESQRIAVELAEQGLADTRVLAPIDGVVTSREVQIGQIISSGISTVGGGTTVLTLSDLSYIFVHAAVDESDIGQVEVGQPVIITVDAYRGERFRGRVERVATRGVEASNVVTFDVKIEVIGESKELLKPEMTANVEIVAARKADVLHVPVEAVVRRRDARIVKLRTKSNETEERTVQVGISDGVRQEITAGLEEGDEVEVSVRTAESQWRSGSGAQAAQRGRAMRMIFRGRRNR